MKESIIGRKLRHQPQLAISLVEDTKKRNNHDGTDFESPQETNTDSERHLRRVETLQKGPVRRRHQPVGRHKPRRVAKPRRRNGNHEEDKEHHFRRFRRRVDALLQHAGNGDIPTRTESVFQRVHVDGSQRHVGKRRRHERCRFVHRSTRCVHMRRR